MQSKTDFGKPGYGGPCPPKGDKPHRYIFTVYALKVDQIDADENASGALVGYMLNANSSTRPASRRRMEGSSCPAAARRARARPGGVPELSLLETRVLGVLVEKQHTVPDTYPLTLNALAAGCNQKTSRDPVLRRDGSGGPGRDRPPAGCYRSSSSRAADA